MDGTLIPPGLAARLRYRGGEIGTTATAAPGLVQANLCILPADLAGDFLRFCQRNPKPCPVLAVSEPGDPAVPSMGADLDLRTDVPLYRVWRDGELIETTPDISAHWRPDLVAFLIGCSFSFEEAMAADGLPLRHVQCGTNIAMFRTSIACAPAGPFAGPMVVSMRPLRAADAIRAVQITSRFPSVHGAPVHLGRPDLIGIADLNAPDYGDVIPVADDELPVFWACGVTPQSVVAKSRPPFCITHAPGHMLVTDIPNSRLAIL